MGSLTLLMLFIIFVIKTLRHKKNPTTFQAAKLALGFLLIFNVTLIFEFLFI